MVTVDADIRFFLCFITLFCNFCCIHDPLTLKYKIFTELALWADSVAKSQCPSVVCVCVGLFVCAILENPLLVGLEIFG